MNAADIPVAALEPAVGAQDEPLPRLTLDLVRAAGHEAHDEALREARSLPGMLGLGHGETLDRQWADDQARGLPGTSPVANQRPLAIALREKQHL